MKKMMSQVDSKLQTLLPDIAKIFQLKRSLEVKVDMLKLLDNEIINHTDDEVAIGPEIEQSDEFKLKGAVCTAIIRTEKGSSGVPSTLPRSGSTDTDSAGISGAASSISTRSKCMKLSKLALHSFSCTLPNGSPGAQLNLPSMTMTSW